MFGKKKRTNASADLSEQAMSDSLRAAQVIFQRHADSQTSLNSGSLGASSPASAAPPRIRKSNSTMSSSRSTQQGPWRNPSVKGSQQQLSRPMSPTPTESAQAAAAQAAAAIAHMTLSRESDHQNDELAEFPGLSHYQGSTASIGHLTRNNDSKGEPVRRESAPKEAIPLLRPAVIQSASTPSTAPKQASTSRLQLHLDVRPTSQPQRPSQLKTRASSPNIRFANNGHSPKICRSESRTLVGRIPPPNIYLQDPDADQPTSGDEIVEDGRSVNPGSSSSSIASSSSAMSFITGGSSYVGDEDALDSANEDLDTDVGDYQDSEYALHENSPLDDAHDQKTQFTSSTVNLSPDASELETPTSPVPTNATYGKLNRIGKGNVTYQGTLPDLIPNHTRRTRMEKFKTKLFGSKHRADATNDPTSTSSLSADGEGRPVVTTNHNLKFKTTMRGNDRRSSNEPDSKGIVEGGANDGSATNEALTDSDDDDSDTVEDRVEEKKRRRRAARLRRGLRHTAAAVPYTHHLHHHEHRNDTKRKGFNEDKPWKSHKDVGFVTAQERKRYEGMWVSNRCVYLELLPWWESVISGRSAPPVKLPEDGLMLNLVVQDIWSRSNLPTDLLMQIYDKVDTRNDGTLDRKSFIVGMWLVDQCLYGRKLPREIDQQVWDSVDRYVVNVINSNTMKQMDKSKKRQMKQEIKNIKKDIKNVHK